ncbi:metallophosphoesterase [Roseateles koreensis]|uniref:Metallophosphoesterase n=1 Tax=Roseateles koreensis TaxID=2987526 RepID=A0ABT5KQQ6_9BURK|nr:metallophosphoesterase [Roseateles koreensis]MDC8784805.1 metallophosphoesterase [Roseateles koreensis]
MRVQLISDLHLERYPDFQPKAAAGAEVLVLAGDIGSYQAGSRLTSDDFGLERFSPRRPGAQWPRVLYVPGNHEFDGLEYADAYARLRELCTQLAIEWLDREVITIGTVRFVGAILWSDFDAFASAAPTLTQQLQLREKAYRAANFYLRKNSTRRGDAPVLAEGIRTLALESQAWLRHALQTPFEGCTVAVTHFAPTLRSADPRYGLTPGTAGFCNAMDDLLPLADVWMHGHLHCANDYEVSGQDASGRDFACRVVANPLGYFSKGEQATFRSDWGIDLPSR